MAEADAGETVVSSTVKDLVVGSGIAFEDRGQHNLKGVREPGDSSPCHVRSETHPPWMARPSATTAASPSVAFAWLPGRIALASAVYMAMPAKLSVSHLRGFPPDHEARAEPIAGLVGR
jgi:hypothetical protein